MEVKVSKATIVRTIAYFIVIVNFILQKFGLSPLDINTDEEVLVRSFDTIISLLVFGLGFWYNNSFTADAINADKIKQHFSNPDPKKVEKLIKLLEELEAEEV